MADFIAKGTPEAVRSSDIKNEMISILANNEK